MTIPIVPIIVTLIIVGLLLWVIEQIPMDAVIKRIIRVVVIVLVVLWLLQLLGLLGGFTIHASKAPAAPVIRAERIN